MRIWIIMLLMNLNLNMEKLSPNFGLDELTYSATACRLKIDNTPSPEIKDSLTNLAKNVLQPIRNKWGAPIVVTSGYRCPIVNKAVGGAAGSQHMKGEAADVKVGGKTENKKLFNLIVKMINSGELTVGQLIDEYNYKWIHVSLPTPRHKNEVLHIK